MKRRHLLAATLALGFGLATPALAQTAKSQPEKSQPEKPNVTIAVGGKLALYYLPLNIADLKGFFKEEGLNVTIADFQGGSKSVQAVVGGSADVLSSAYEHMINLQVLDQPLKSFVLQGRYPGFVLSVTPELAKDWKGVQSLVGKNVGVTAPGSSTNKMIDLLMIRAGLKPSDVSIIGVGAGPSVLAAFRNGQIQATVQADPASTLLASEGLAEPKVDTRTLEGTEEVYGGPMPAASLSATDAFIAANPKTVQALTNAMVKALHFIQTASNDEILDVLPADMMVGGDRKLYAQMLDRVRPAFSPDGRLSKEAVETTYEALKIYNPKVRDAKNVDLDATYTNAFVDKAGAGG